MLRRLRVVDTAVVVACGAAVAVYVVVALARLRYPFELQWMEGGAVTHVERLLDGRSIYPAPSVEFASFTYPPLYFWVSALVAQIVGVGFLPLRLVSFAASLGTMAVLLALGRTESARWLPGVVAAGVFAAAFRATGAWYDIARVDSLFLFLTLAGILVLRRARSGWGAAAAGVVFALSALTKQTALFAVGPVVLYLLVRRPRTGVSLAAGFAVLYLPVSLALNAASSGWYRFSTADILLGHPVEERFWGEFWTGDLGRRLWPAIVVVALVAVAAARSRRRIDTVPPPMLPWGLYGALALGMVAGSWVSRLHTGGYDDVLMPAYAAVALLCGLAFGWVATVRPALLAPVAAAVVLQVFLLRYSPAAQIPTASDHSAGRSLIAAVEAIPGDVMVVSHPWYAAMAGKATHSQTAAVNDLVRGRARVPGEIVRASIAEAVRERRFAAIVFDGPDDHLAFPPDFDRYYQPVAAPAGARVRNLTDIASRPTEWWLRRDLERIVTPVAQGPR